MNQLRTYWTGRSRVIGGLILLVSLYCVGVYILELNAMLMDVTYMLGIYLILFSHAIASQRPILEEKLPLLLIAIITSALICWHILV